MPNNQDTPEDQPQVGTTDLLAEAFRDGRSANDHNRRIRRQRHGSGVPRNNPYLAGTDQHRRWREGYDYQDMINDG